MVGVSGDVTRELALAAVQPPAPAARLNMVLRCRGGGGNDRIPGQEEVLEYTSTGRRPRIQYNSDPGRQTPFWLCPECGNMLYPKENAATKTLQRVCRNCQHTDAAERNLVFVNDQRPPNVSAEVTADVTKDPTLPRTHQCLCTNCQHTEAVFFQAVTRGDEGMKLIFMCTRCARTHPPCSPTYLTILSHIRPAMTGTLLTRVFLTCALQVCVPMGAIARAPRPDFALST